MRAKDIMRPDPVTVSEETPVSEILKTLYSLDVRHLPVLEKGALVGIISDRDLREVATPALLPNETAELMKLPARNVMSTEVMTVTPEAPIGEIIDLMLEGGFGAVPVVENQSKKLLGIVSYVDILRSARDLFDTG